MLLTPWYPDVQVTDQIRIDDLCITFKRTIRVPDNRDSNNLPPDCGTFPLYKVDRYATKLPLNMAQKGGLFLPMYQKEALWISFASKNRYAIKIFVGGINAISGEPAVPNDATTLRRRNRIRNRKPIQDYLAIGVNGQPWLDGVAVEPGKVRQFVAMPMGSGHSVEAQMTGEETTAGIQFEVTRLDVKELLENNVEELSEPEFDEHLKTGWPSGTVVMRLIAFSGDVTWDRTLADYNITNLSDVYIDFNFRIGFNPDLAPAPEMNIAAGGLIDQGIVHIPQYDYLKTVPITFNVQVLNSASFKHVTGEDPPKSTISAKTYADAGYPFFSMYEEPTTISGDFEGLKSVAQIDDVNEESMPADMAVIKIGAVGLLNPRGSKQELELEWEVRERLGQMWTLF